MVNKKRKAVEIRNDIIKRIINEINKIKVRKRRPHTTDNVTYIKAILTRLQSGLSYVNVSEIYNISPSNLHRKFTFWTDNNVFKNAFHYAINTNAPFIDYSEAYIDTSVVINKLGYANSTGWNGYSCKKHKSNKFSCIVSKNGIPLNIIVDKSNIHDIKLLDKTLPKRTYFKVLYGDKGYISNNVKSILKKKRKINFITGARRNQLSQPNVNTKSRIVVEHFNSLIKQNRIINVRYDKYLSNYHSMLYLAALKRTLQIIYKALYAY